MTHLVDLVTTKQDAVERYSIERHFAIAQGRKREATRLLMDMQKDEATANLISATVQSWLGVTSMEEVFAQVSDVRLHLLYCYDLYEAWLAMQARLGNTPPVEWTDQVSVASLAFDQQCMATLRILPDSLEVLTL
ncbi:MAG: hypothetical protein E4H01_04965 [Lysobacterales bacterium]|nr:MAG: hypothetical protein E4H01_04965 [Xanthomonadales bacterium]